METRGDFVSIVNFLIYVISEPFLRSDVTSQDSVITFNIYDRNVEDQGFLGMVQIKPVLVHDQTVDNWYP